MIQFVETSLYIFAFTGFVEATINIVKFLKEQNEAALKKSYLLVLKKKNSLLF